MFKTLVTDVDGVFTSGQYLYSENGKEYKIFGAHDSDGIKIIKQLFNIEVVAISADERGFSITKKRMDDIGIPLFLVPETQRLEWLKDNYESSSTIFVGDGIYDAACLQYSSLGYAPKNATKLAKKHADCVLTSNGGEGVFLEIAIYLLNFYYPHLEKDFYKRIGL